MGCHLDFYANTKRGNRGTWGMLMHTWLCTYPRACVCSSTFSNLRKPIQTNFHCAVVYVCSHLSFCRLGLLCMCKHVCMCVQTPERPVQATVLSTECWVSALVSWQMYPQACPLALTARPQRCIQLQPAALCLMSLASGLNKDWLHHSERKTEGGEGKRRWKKNVEERLLKVSDLDKRMDWCWEIVGRDG